MAAPAPQTTLRGRAAEIRELGAVSRALSGRLAIVLMEGEGGIGKTRLLTETLHLATSRGFEAASAKAEEMEQTRPFGVADALGCVRSASDPLRAAISALLSTHASGERGAITISSDPGPRLERWTRSVTWLRRWRRSRR